MKKILIIIFFLSFNLIAQEKESLKNNDIYIYIKRGDFYGHSGLFYASFNIKSKDERFLFNNFIFLIYDPYDLNRKKLTLYSLGKRVNISLINYINPVNYFNNKSVLEIHDYLSLADIREQTRVFIITEIPKDILISETDRTKTHMVWLAKYSGTRRNFSLTQLGKGPFFSK